MTDWTKNSGQVPDCNWVEVQFFNGSMGVITVVNRTHNLRWGLDHHPAIICWREADEPMEDRIARLEAEIEKLSSKEEQG